MENKNIRKHFKFYKSYYDVFCELPNDKEKIAFIEAIFKKQFFNIDTELKGMAKFAYVSQKHNIENQVQGFIDKMGEIDTPMVPPPLGGMQGGIVPPPLQPVTYNIQHTTNNEKKVVGFFEEELSRVSDTALSNSLREWWEYKKWKYDSMGWKKQITMVLKYPSNAVCDRIDEAIASGWTWMNLGTMKTNGKPVEKEVPIKTVKRTFNFLTGEQL